MNDDDAAMGSVELSGVLPLDEDDDAGEVLKVVGGGVGGTMVRLPVVEPVLALSFFELSPLLLIIFSRFFV